MKRRRKTGHDFSWLKELALAFGVVLAVFFVLLSVYPPTYSFTFKQIALPVPSTQI